MRSRALFPLLVALGACVGPPVADDNAPIVCTHVGCLDIAGARLALGIAPQEVQRSTITVCRNDVCSAGLGPPEGEARSLPGPLDVEVFGQSLPGSMFAQIDVIITVADPRDGDLYVIRVSPPDRPNETLLSVEKAVTYAGFQPNGPRCPPDCRIANITD